MRDLFIYFGSGIVFGIGASFGVAVSMWCVAIVRGQMIQESKEHIKKVEKLLEEKCMALWEISASLNKERTNER